MDDLFAERLTKARTPLRWRPVAKVRRVEQKPRTVEWAVDEDDAFAEELLRSIEERRWMPVKATAIEQRPVELDFSVGS